jgi:hypothetical protein
MGFYSPFFKQLRIAVKLVCSLREATTVLLSEAEASTAVTSAKFAVVVSGVIGRSAMYTRYNKGPRTLPWGTPALIGKSSVYSVSVLTRK